MESTATTARSRFTLTDLTFILFFSARLLTYLFVAFLGTKGVFVSMGIIALLLLVGMGKKVFIEKEYSILVFTATAFAILALSFGTFFVNPSIKPWLFGRETGIVTMIFDVRKAIFGFLVILLVAKPERMFRNLRIACFLRLAYYLYQIILFNVHGHWGAYFSTTSRFIYGVYNMSLGYELVFCAVFLIVDAFRRGGWKSLIPAGIVMGFSVYFGSRGVLVVYAGLFLLLLLFDVIPKKAWKKAAIAICIVSLTVLATIPLVPQFNGLIYRFARVVDVQESEDENALSLEDIVTSRTINSLEEGTFTESNGRFRIWELSMKNYLKRPILGHGMYGDRQAVGVDFRWGYSHNILLEAMSHFGIFGILGILALAVLVIRAFLKRDGDPYYYPMLFFMALSVKLVLSDSFWFNENFWALLALVYLHYRKDGKTSLAPTLFANGVFLTAFLGFAFLGIRDDIARTDFKTVTYDEPTVIVNFERGYQSVYTFYELFKEKGYPATVYLVSSKLNRSDYLSKKQIAEMRDNGWDFQGETFDYRGILSLNASERKDQYEKTERMFLRMGLPLPQGLYLPYGTTNMSAQTQLLDYRKAVIRSGETGIYRRLTKPGLMDLTSVRINLSKNLPRSKAGWELREEGRKNVLDQIDRAYQRKSLLLLTIADYPAEEHFFYTVLEELEAKGFTFSTLSEELEKGKITDPSQRTFLNWLYNTYTADIVL